MASSTICIVGAAGFFGSHLAESLVEHGRAVIYQDSGDRFGRMLARGAVNRSRVEFFDLADPAAVERLLEYDVIVHLAALAHVDYSLFRAAEVVKNNVAATVSVLEAARRSGAKVVLASSVEVYGGTAGHRFLEGETLVPQSPYGATKVASEALAESYRRSYDVDVTTLRFTNLYGPWQAPDRVIPRVLRQRALGIVSTATAGRIRDFLHVEDAVRAIEISIDADLPHSVYNVCTGTGIDIETLVRALRDNDRAQVRVSDTDHGREVRLVADPSLFMGITGWHPRRELAQEIEALQNWSNENAAWLARFDAIVRADVGSEASLSDALFPLPSHGDSNERSDSTSPTVHSTPRLV